MTRITFAYIVQLDLPGSPIKIGHSCKPRTRWETFKSATPCDTRMIGITLNGVEREQEMLAATESAKIHGEWRRPTAELADLIGRYHRAGEWFHPVEKPNELFHAMDVRNRILRASPSHKDHTLSHRSHQYWWAANVLAAAQGVDPLLGVHWCGFDCAETVPNLEWPRQLRAAA